MMSGEQLRMEEGGWRRRVGQSFCSLCERSERGRGDVPENERAMTPEIVDIDQTKNKGPRE
jgi:hypothetical protein